MFTLPVSGLIYMSRPNPLLRLVFPQLTSFCTLGCLNKEFSDFFYPQIKDALPHVLPRKTHITYNTK